MITVPLVFQPAPFRMVIGACWSTVDKQGVPFLIALAEVSPN